MTTCLTVAKYPGSKARIAPILAAALPTTRVYLDPMVGGGSVLLARPVSPVEVVNDLDGAVVNFWRVLRDAPEDLAHAITCTPYSRAEYVQACGAPATDPLERARRFVVRSWQGYGSSNQTSNGWSRTIGRTTNLQGLRTSHYHGQRWTALPARIRAVADRLRAVEVECRDVFTLLQEYAHPWVTVYLDPPYPMETRGGRRLYTHEFTGDHHAELLRLACLHPGPVAISSYRNDLYDAALGGWERSILRGSDQTGSSRAEALYRNPLAVVLAGPLTVQPLKSLEIRNAV